MDTDLGLPRREFFQVGRAIEEAAKLGSGKKADLLRQLLLHT
ncbi:Uncharacterised protein [Mycobacterium tuberculosis]|nr:Uncharacterised protein [Mycobacterium tuberculosis]COZ84228.1 Uncharacterised protein [Mycobacterium tuberculosis]